MKKLDKTAEFMPPIWLKNPHIQTMLPKLIVKDNIDYQRVLLKDSLGESDVAFDFLMAKGLQYHDDFYDQDRPLVVLFHGMEGSSQSHYAKTLAKYIGQAGCHFVVSHFRSCGGVSVSGRVFYNAGDTKELHHYLSYFKNRFSKVYAVGVSLGGNVLAKYMGEYQDLALADRAVVVSAPVDLASASVAMERFLGRHLYTPYLLNPIIKKALDNHLTDDELHALSLAKRIGDFDDVFTAPRHGFRSKNDYYRQASALPYLIHITKPTLILTAKDDPFLGVTATQNDVSDQVVLLDTKHGGHIGFLDYDYRRHCFDLGFVPRLALGFFG